MAKQLWRNNEEFKTFADTKDPAHLDVITKQTAECSRFMSVSDVDVVDVPMEGDCFFQSLSYLLYDGSIHRHADIREQICLYMKANAPSFQLPDSFWEEFRDWDAFVDSCRQQGVWTRDYFTAAAQNYYREKGYEIRVWRACFQDNFKLFETETSSLAFVPSIRSRYSLIRCTNGASTMQEGPQPPKNGYLDVLHHNDNHYMALKTADARILTLEDVVAFNNNQEDAVRI